MASVHDDQTGYGAHPLAAKKRLHRPWKVDYFPLGNETWVTTVHQYTDAITIHYYTFPSPNPVRDAKGQSMGFGEDLRTPMETPLTAGDIASRRHSGRRTPAPNSPIFLTFAPHYIHVRQDRVESAVRDR